MLSRGDGPPLSQPLHSGSSSLLNPTSKRRQKQVILTPKSSDDVTLTSHIHLSHENTPRGPSYPPPNQPPRPTHRPHDRPKTKSGTPRPAPSPADPTGDQNKFPMRVIEVREPNYSFFCPMPLPDGPCFRVVVAGVMGVGLWICV